MQTSPRLQQIEAQLQDDPDDEFLRYAEAMEHSSLGNDDWAVQKLRALIGLKPDSPYLPAFLMAGQALVRLDRETEAAEILKTGIAASEKLPTADAAHARSEMQSLLASIE